MARFRKRRRKGSWLTNYDTCSEATGFTVSALQDGFVLVGQTDSLGIGGNTASLQDVGQRAVVRRVISDWTIQVGVELQNGPVRFACRLYKLTVGQLGDYSPDLYAGQDALEGHGKLLWERRFTVGVHDTPVAIGMLMQVTAGASLNQRGTQQEHPWWSRMDWKGAQPVYENELLLFHWQMPCAEEASMGVKQWVRSYWQV